MCCLGSPPCTTAPILSSPSQDPFYTPDDKNRSHGAQHYPAQSNVDIQFGYVLRGTATAHGRRGRRRRVVAEIAAGQADVREKHLARGENFAQVSKIENLQTIKSNIGIVTSNIKS